MSDVKSFLKDNQEKNSSASGSNFITSFSEEINYEDITNTDEELVAIPVRTIYKNLYSRITLLEIDGILQSAVVSLNPFEHSTSSSFSGELIITDIDGNFIKAFKIEGNILVSEYIIKNLINKNQKDFDKNSTDTSYAKNCDFAGDQWCIENEEVIIVEYKPTPYVSITQMYPAGGGESESNCEVGCDNNWNPTGGGGGYMDSSPEPKDCPEGFYQNLEGECIESLPCDTNDQILDSGSIQSAFSTIWEQSGALNPNIPMDSRIEQGGWIVENNGRYGFIPFDSSWTRTSCGINPPVNWASTIPDNLVGYVHTHPFYHVEDIGGICDQTGAVYQGEPSDDDLDFLHLLMNEVGNFSLLGYIIDGDQISSFDFTRRENLQNHQRCGY